MLLRVLAHFLITEKFSMRCTVADCAVAFFLLLFLHTSWFPLPYVLSYFFFFSLLIITLYTDIHYMLISRFVTLYSIPIGLLLAAFNALPITVPSSIFGSVS